MAAISKMKKERKRERKTEDIKHRPNNKAQTETESL